MGGLARFLARSGRAGDCSHMDLVVDKTGGGQWEHSQLDSCCEASWIGNVMRIADLLACALAQSIYKLPSCIISV